MTIGEEDNYGMRVRVWCLTLRAETLHIYLVFYLVCGFFFVFFFQESTTYQIEKEKKGNKSLILIREKTFL